jgi:hypothetical protein
MEEKVAIRAFRAELRNWQVFARPFRIRKTSMRSKNCAARAALIINPAHDEQRRRERSGKCRPASSSPEDKAAGHRGGSWRCRRVEPRSTRQNAICFEPDCRLQRRADEMRATAIGPPHGRNADSQCGPTTRPARPSSCCCRSHGNGSCRGPPPRRCRVVTGIVEARLPQGMALCRLSRSGDP